MHCLSLAVKADLEGYEMMDIVGTGGDGKNTFNISTLACFIVAGTGQKVAKHGNYGATTISGASNVMEQLGYKLSNDPGKLKREVEKANICFLHAPLFHPALKAVGADSQKSGYPYFFQYAGANGESGFSQISADWCLQPGNGRIYTYLLQKTDSSFTIIHSLDGYDEISLTGDTKVITNEGEQVMTPEQLGKRMVSPSDIYGGNSRRKQQKFFWIF